MEPDMDWLMADYRAYLLQADDREAWAQTILSFDEWLAVQPGKYRLEHGAEHSA